MVIKKSPEINQGLIDKKITSLSIFIDRDNHKIR